MREFDVAAATTCSASAATLPRSSCRSGSTDVPRAVSRGKPLGQSPPELWHTR
jgi:hypothetical protein